MAQVEVAVQVEQEVAVVQVVIVVQVEQVVTATVQTDLMVAVVQVEQEVAVVQVVTVVQVEVAVQVDQPDQQAQLELLIRVKYQERVVLVQVYLLINRTS
jgi:hypothetical protein